MDSAGPKPTILVVDDNEQNRAVASAALEDEGYRVVVAADGQAGLDAFVAEQPDCVLLDVRMPGMDGLAVCRAIRKLPGGTDVPIVFLTAQRDLDTFDQALQAGGDDFLNKPVQPSELAVRVQAALKMRKLSTNLREHFELVRQQRDELIRLQLQKEQLTAFLVHDLKNPVNAIDLHAQLLLRNRDLPDKVRDSVERMRVEGRSLLRMLLNLLDISRSEEGQLTVTPALVDLDALSAELLQAFEVKARHAGVTLAHAPEKCSLRADAALLQRVLENLLDNAIRHAPEGSEVRLHAREHDGQVEIRVSDQGVGVPSQLRERVFQRFVQLEHGERLVTRSGRGLGLTFCRLAVEAHGGSVSIEDGELGGSVFCVRLPA